MNERIQELLVEAHKQTKGGIYSGHLSELTEKFAELIVRECMNAIYDIDDLGGYHFKAANAIKKHFGVE